jgi:hypothetical protein
VHAQEVLAEDLPLRLLGELERIAAEVTLAAADLAGSVTL